LAVRAVVSQRGDIRKNSAGVAWQGPGRVGGVRGDR
jgi:hypothetical protein